MEEKNLYPMIPPQNPNYPPPHNPNYLPPQNPNYSSPRNPNHLPNYAGVQPVNPSSPGFVVPTPPPTTVVSPAVGPTPTRVTCSSCKAEILTRVEHKPVTKTHLFAFLLCLLGCLPCVCIPYCMDSCQKAEHYCPNCKAYLGVYNN